MGFIAQHRACRQPGLGGGVLMGAAGARCRRVANGPKAPAGRFWPMPTRRPLVDGKCGAVASVSASPGCGVVCVGRQPGI